MTIQNQTKAGVSVGLSLLLLAAGGALSNVEAAECDALFVPVVNEDQDRNEPECAAPQTDPLAGYAKGFSCKLQVGFVHPTQPAVGMTAVDCKRDKLADKSESKLDKYLSKGKRVVPTVIGPDGNYYITDHHHLSTAVYKTLQEQPSMEPDIRLYAQIVGNFYQGQAATGETAMAKFWDTMKSCNNAYLSYLGQPVDPLDPAQMPTALAAMKDDPYRTLSRWVRDADGYIKPSVDPANFLEFTWGDKFRRDLGVDFPLCDIDQNVNSEHCQKQIGLLRDNLSGAMASARAYDSVRWIREGNCAGDMRGNPQALIACGYNSGLLDVDVNKYITADRGCETADEIAWETVADGQPPGDTLAYFEYAHGHVTVTHEVCRAEHEGVFYAGVLDSQTGHCSYVDDKGKLSDSADTEALTGVQAMYLWTEYTDDSDDDFFDDAISVGNSDDSDVGQTYVCAAGDRIGWVKKGKQKCHLSPDGLHVPFAVLTQD